MMLRYTTRRFLKKLSRWAIMPIMLFVIGVLLGAVFFTAQTMPELPSTEKEKEQPLQPLSFDPIATEGYLPVDLKLAPGRILLTKNCTAIVLTTTPQKTYTIQRGAENKFEVRPEPYDLLEDIIEIFNVKVDMVRLNSMENDIFYAELILSNSDTILSLDAKPSDALAVSARFDAPIFVKEDLFWGSGQRVC